MVGTKGCQNPVKGAICTWWNYWCDAVKRNGVHDLAAPEKRSLLAWGQEVLRALRGRLSREARVAEEWRALASPRWAPALGAYVCAAHWLEHTLREANGPLVLLDSGGAPHARAPGWLTAYYADCAPSRRRLYTPVSRKVLRFNGDQL